MYPGTCRRLRDEDRDEVERRLAAGRRHSWRLAVPGAQEPGAFVAFDDLVYGAQSFNVGRELGDVILRRSDGPVCVPVRGDGGRLAHGRERRGARP